MQGRVLRKESMLPKCSRAFKLGGRVKNLKDNLAINSRNSSKPSSKDDFKPKQHQARWLIDAGKTDIENSTES
ncbi:MAG: hypothetical protein ACI81P_003482 [Neolewinella sp.]|jgi:hypothetical protein